MLFGAKTFSLTSQIYNSPRSENNPKWYIDVDGTGTKEEVLDKT